MASLSKCLNEAGALVSQSARADIMRRADVLRKAGTDNAQASRKAVEDYLKERSGALDEVETAFKEGTTLYEAEPPKTEAGKAEAEAAVSRVDQVVRDMPDLMVQMDGMDAPMKAADFLAMVRAEADELAADGPLMQIAAECALLHP